MFRKPFSRIGRERDKVCVRVCVCVCAEISDAQNTKAVSSEALKYLLIKWLQQETNNPLQYAQSDATYFHAFKYSQLSRHPR